MYKELLKKAKKSKLGRLFSPIYWKLRGWVFRLYHKIFVPPEIFRDRYYVEDNSEAVLYLRNKMDWEKLKDYQPQQFLPPMDSYTPKIKVSLIATVWNEEKNIKAWADSVFGQTRLPDEIVITDAGSTDQTVSLLTKLAEVSPVPFHLVIEPGVNIAKGRNIAISHAKYDYIVTTDFGCRLHRDWLEKILIPFEVDEEIQVVAGMYQAVDSKGKKIDRMAWWTKDTLDNPKLFLPSARSCAFKKTIWEKIGGYPEWLTLTGEDTYYALELKKYASKWAVVPEAVVEWNAPENIFAYWKKITYWSAGDGESGISASHYWKLFLKLGLSVIFSIFLLLLIVSLWVLSWAQPELVWTGAIIGVWLIVFYIGTKYQKIKLAHSVVEIGGLFAKIIGFYQGARHRHIIDKARRELVKGTIFILSGVQIDDTGGGARCTQFALEFLRRKYAVVFINKYPKYESVELNLRIDDPNLYKFTVSEFSWPKFVNNYAWLLDKELLAAVVEMPLEEFVPILQAINKQGVICVYDLLDEWDTSLGGDWYSRRIEGEIIDSCQVLVATAPVLVNRLKSISQREVTLLPNAVNSYLFNPKRYYPVPIDFPRASWTCIYIGALWGEWFDWGLLVTVARQYPEAAVVVIGDYRGQCPEVLPNLHFLGLKSQRDLPAYLAHADVAIIPWKIGNITQATSPLKVYEFLSMQIPVVAPLIDPLQGIPGVFLASTSDKFVQEVGRVKDIELPESELIDFIQNNNWQSRIDQLVKLIKDVKVEIQ